MNNKNVESEVESASELTRLLCCPFCGGGAVMSGPHYIGTAYFKVTCNDCGISTEKYAGKKPATKVWNKRKIQNNLIDAYEDYIKLLHHELDDLAGLAYTHGWKSDRIEAGKEARKQIKNFKEKVT